MRAQAILLGGLAMKRRWQEKRKKDGITEAATPNMVCSTAVHVCWCVRLLWAAWPSPALDMHDATEAITRANHLRACDGSLCCSACNGWWQLSGPRVKALRACCREKLFNYFDIEPKYISLTEDCFVATPEKIAAACDKNTIGVVAILGTTYSGHFEDVEGIDAAISEAPALVSGTGWSP